MGRNSAQRRECVGEVIDRLTERVEKLLTRFYAGVGHSGSSVVLRATGRAEFTRKRKRIAEQVARPLVSERASAIIRTNHPEGSSDGGVLRDPHPSACGGTQDRRHATLARRRAKAGAARAVHV